MYTGFLFFVYKNRLHFHYLYFYCFFKIVFLLYWIFQITMIKFLVWVAVSPSQRLASIPRREHFLLTIKVYVGIKIYIPFLSTSSFFNVRQATEIKSSRGSSTNWKSSWKSEYKYFWKIQGKQCEQRSVYITYCLFWPCNSQWKQILSGTQNMVQEEAV